MESFSGRLWVDLDGVLADFDQGVQSVTGKLPSQIDLKTMWRTLAKTPNFYANLEWMSDGKTLWSYIAKYNPIVLSGLPMGNWAKGQKREWVGRELGWHVPAILGMASDKHTNAMKFLGTTDLEGCILIDDRVKTKPVWESAGGTFILHTSSSASIAKLKEYDL